MSNFDFDHYEKSCLMTITDHDHLQPVWKEARNLPDGQYTPEGSRYMVMENHPAEHITNYLIEKHIKYQAEAQPYQLRLIDITEQDVILMKLTLGII